MQEYEMKRSGTNSETLFSAKKVPVSQNKLGKTKQEATKSSHGKLGIVFDPDYQFAYNQDFDSELMVYDQDYNNEVPSKVFEDYYDEVADYLVERYELIEGTVFDVGCGSGKFLYRMALRYPKIEGIGVDPAHRISKYSSARNVTFYTDKFTAKYIGKSPDLVICRHVLEHIDDPVSFLREMFASLCDFQNIKVFIEVPDLDWILANFASWDFCYEHCNYFTDESLKYCIEEAGAEVVSLSNGFGEQYLYAEAIVNPNKKTQPPAMIRSRDERQELLNNFIDNHQKEYIASVQKVNKLNITSEVVIWGMGTKGILYTNFMVEKEIFAKHCVDVNAEKQGRYTPVTGIEVISPNELPKNTLLSIVCMNPNYAEEIREKCESLGLDFQLYSPELAKINVGQSEK